jgi:ParB family chromosome partitioning protein
MTNISINQLHPFKDHPYKVLDNDEMNSLIESVQEYGIMSPLIVRPLEGTTDQYEIISRHRRFRAAQKAGLNEVPAFIRPVSRDEAAIMLVDSNLHREHILPSEKAFAYKMKYDAMRRLGRDKESISSKTGKRQWANVQLAKEVGESRNQIHRYLRLVYVIPSILDLVDKKALALMTAVEISYLTPEVQEMLYVYMLENDICKSFQIYALRDYFKDHDTITKMEMIRILNENAPVNENNRFQKIIITREKLKEYFPVFYTKSQMEKVLFDLLGEWKKINVQ